MPPPTRITRPSLGPITGGGRISSNNGPARIPRERSVSPLTSPQGHRVSSDQPGNRPMHVAELSGDLSTPAPPPPLIGVEIEDTSVRNPRHELLSL